MKRNLYILITLVVIIVLFFLLTKNTTAPVVTDRSGEEIPTSEPADREENRERQIVYVCDQGEITLVLSGEDFMNAEVIFSDDISASINENHESHSLARVASASGTRYATANEDVVFTLGESETFITKNGEITYENCNEK